MLSGDLRVTELGQHGIERRPRRTCAQHTEEVPQRSLSIGKLVARITAVLRHHRQDEPLAISEQPSIDTPIVLAHPCWTVREVELHRPTAAGLQIDEPRPELRAQHVARVRLAVQQLLGSAVVGDGSPQVPQCAVEELPIGGVPFALSPATRRGTHVIAVPPLPRRANANTCSRRAPLTWSAT